MQYVFKGIQERSVFRKYYHLLQCITIIEGQKMRSTYVLWYDNSF